jgi:protein-disulfide isomerase
LVTLTLALWVSACSGQTDGSVAGAITVDPMMTRGPADAAVTIVEFSDYQ